VEFCSDYDFICSLRVKLGQMIMILRKKKLSCDYIISLNSGLKNKYFLKATGLLNNSKMPLRNKKARQAKAQRVQGENFFKKGFINNLDNLNDPDWVNEEDLDSDSEFEGNGGWAVSISEVTMPDFIDVSDLEDEEEKVSERRNGKGGIKRKAAGNGLDEYEKGAEESEAHQILNGAEALWKEKFSKVSSSRIQLVF